LQIKYSKHITERLAIRKIEYNLPKEIFKNAEERFVDTETGHTIAVRMEMRFGKKRHMMIAYRHEDEVVTLLTIHPLKEGQKENRVESGRWRKTS